MGSTEVPIKGNRVDGTGGSHSSVYNNHNDAWKPAECQNDTLPAAAAAMGSVDKFESSLQQRVQRYGRYSFLCDGLLAVGLREIRDAPGVLVLATMSMRTSVGHIK